MTPLALDAPFLHRPVKRRATTQLRDVQSLMRYGDWMLLSSIAEKCKAPPQSVSARLRDLRKSKFGGYTIEKRRVARNQWAYRMVVASSDNRREI